MNRHFIGWGFLMIPLACDPAPVDADADFRGEIIECVDPEFTPYEDEFVKMTSPSRIESIAGDLEFDKEANTVYAEKSSVYTCRCDSGCGGSACQITLDPISATCTGTCDGTISSDGRPCWGCTWHVVAPTPTLPPTSSPPSVDPDAGGGKPPGTDPPPGSVDPTF